MANHERGEVEITVNGTPYTLKLSMNAAAVIQSKHKKTIGQLMTEAATLDFVAIRGLVWLLLQKHHAKQFKTEEDAGNFIDEAGGIKVLFDAIEQLSSINNDGEDADPNETAQRTGTGESSTSTLAASA